jgi:hypothetical protein
MVKILLKMCKSPVRWASRPRSVLDWTEAFVKGMLRGSWSWKATKYKFNLTAAGKNIIIWVEGRLGRRGSTAVGASGASTRGGVT